MCARRIVVVLPALFTRKEVQLGSGTIHEARARGATRGWYTHATCVPTCVRVSAKVARCVSARHHRRDGARCI